MMKKNRASAPCEATRTLCSSERTDSLRRQQRPAELPPRLRGVSVLSDQDTWPESHAGAGPVHFSMQRQLQQLRLINDVAVRLSSILSVEELLQEIVRLVTTTFGYYYVHIHSIDRERGVTNYRAGWLDGEPRRGHDLRIRDEGIIGWVAWRGESMLVSDVLCEPKYRFDHDVPLTRSEIAVPIKRGDKVIGVLDAQDIHVGAFDAEDIVLLETLARQISVAMENAALFETLERQTQALDAMVERSARIQEEDRRRIALDLHDGVAQSLVGVRFELETLRLSKPAINRKASESLALVCDALEDATEEMRRVIFDLYPPGLEDIGLVPTVERYASTFGRLTGIQSTCRSTGRPVRLDRATELGIYRIVQESLTNVFKHAPNSSAEIVFQFSSHALRVTIRDHGPGFEADHLASVSDGFGLKSMRRNAERIGSDFHIMSQRGVGTTVEVVSHHAQNRSSVRNG